MAGSFLGQRPFLTASHGWAAPGRDGLRFVPHGVGYPIALVPAAGIESVAGGEAGKVAAAAECAIFSVLLMACWHRLVSKATGSEPSPGAMICLGLCSMALVYGRMPYDVTLSAFLGTLSVLLATEGRDGAAGFAAGAGLLVRLDSIVFLPSLLTDRRRALGLLPGLAAAVAVIAAANWYRFGSPLADGHAGDPAMALTPGFAGLAGLLASPGKGLLLYAPAAFAAAALSRRPRFWLPAALSLLLHSQLQDWTGGTGWGPRFLFPQLPLLLVPLAAPGRRRLLMLLTVPAALASLSACWSDPAAVEQSLGADEFSSPSRQEVVWEPSRSPLVNCVERLGSGTPDLLWARALGRSPVAGGALGSIQTGGAAALLYLAARRRRT